MEISVAKNCGFFTSFRRRKRQTTTELIKRNMSNLNPCTCVKSGKLLIIAALLASSNILRAEDPKPTDIKPPPPKKWDTVITVGATLTRGNSKNFLASGGIATKRNWTNNEVLLGANAGYGETTIEDEGKEKDKRTDSYIKGYGQYNHLFSPRLYAGARITGDHDDNAELAYRATISPLAGYYFLKETNTFLAAELGPSYVREKFFHEDIHDYLGLRIAERGEYNFHSGAKIWESVEYIPKVQEMQNYLVTAEAGISAPISKGFSVSLVLQDSYKSRPATGKLKNDLKLIAGLNYTF
jgi:hypothetical protein